MKNAILCYCKSVGCGGGLSRALPSFTLLEELHERCGRPNGLSATRKEVLLRDCRHFAAVEAKEAAASRANSFPHAGPSTAQAAVRCGDGSGRRTRASSLYQVLRGMAEFIASTGNCDNPAAPLPHGYVQLTPANSLRRADFVLRYTEAALSLSNDRMAAIVALSFGRCSEDGAVTASSDTEPLPFDLRHDMVMMMEKEEAERDETRALLWLWDEDKDLAAPFTSQEVVALLQWCAWHLRTALNSLRQSLPLATDCVPMVLSLMARFFSVLVDGGLWRGAVETLADEIELGDLAFALADQVLELLYSIMPLCTHGRFPSSSLSTAPSLMNRSGGDGGDRASAWRIHPETQRALLCSQREHWGRALGLLLRTQRWNEWLDGKGYSKSPAVATEGERGDFFEAEVLHTLVSLSRPVLHVLEYILAEHGQWGICKELWTNTVRQRRFESLSTAGLSLPPTTALQSPFDIDNIITALAFVNAKPSALRTTTVVNPVRESADVQARFLRILLHLGVVPHRALSATEFAAVLRHSFGLSLNSDSLGVFLLPSFVWRLTAAHPRRVRATLCLLCFQVVLKSELTHTLGLEDLYVLTSILRRFLRGQLQSAFRPRTTKSALKKEQRVEDHLHDFFLDNTVKRPDSENHVDGVVPEEEATLGDLPAEFTTATRRMMTAVEAQILAITEVFMIRRRELFSLKGEEGEEKECTNGRCSSPRGQSTVGSAICFTCTRGKKSTQSRSAVMLSLVSRELMTLLTMTPYGIALGTTWEAALCAISSEIQWSGLSPRLLRAMGGMAQAMTKRVLEPGGMRLLEPLVRLAPFLSPFTVSKIVQSPVGRLLSWKQCLQLVLCTPSASSVQRYLLRRVMQERDAGGLPHVQSLVRALTFPPRLLQVSPLLAMDVRMLAIFGERDWHRALEAYTCSSSRVQWACAPHVVRLMTCADVWRSLHDGDSEALWPVLRTAMRALGGERVAEEVLCSSLRRGMWVTGLALYQVLQTDHPELLRANSRIKAYRALLCRGLLSQSALTRTIAEVVTSARDAKWATACEAFISYVTGGVDMALEKPVSRAFGAADGSSRHWPLLFNAAISSQLSHFAHTVRYSMLFCQGIWERALVWFPPHILPLPLHHRFLLQQVTGLSATDTTSEGEWEKKTRATTCVAREELAVAEATTLCPSFLSLFSSSSSSMSLVQIALQEKLHRTKTLSRKVSVETVEQTLRILQRRGQWEEAVVVCEHAFANRCFPHSASSIVLASSLSSWEAAIACFAYLTTRMRPDAVTAVLALKACMQGRQWMLALRILRQSVLTTAAPPPRVVHYAVEATLDCGAWSAALRVARHYHGTSNPVLANTIMRTYVQAKLWNDAVSYFYEFVARGMRPLDESLAMAITASRTVSAEYRDTARVVGAIASALEDFCHVHGVVLDHVLLVYRGMTAGPVIFF